MKKIFLFTVLCLIGGTAFAQKKNVSRANNELKQEKPNYEEARQLVKEARENPETQNDAKRFTTQFRMIPLLHRSIKGIHIDMYNFTFIHLCNPSASQFSFRIAKIRVILSIQSTGLVNKMKTGKVAPLPVFCRSINCLYTSSVSPHNIS